MMKIFSNWQILWQKKPNKALDSSETLKEGSASVQETIQSNGLLLRTCKEVSLAVFIDCYCHGIYSGLGQATEEEIAQVWEALIQEWSNLMKNEDSDYLIELSGRILELKAHITFVEYSNFLLVRIYDREIIDRLINECGYDGEYPENDREAYLKQLSRVISLCKSKVYELWELNDEYDRLQKNNAGEKTTEEDFERNILRLSKYQGYRINKFKTSVFEYTQLHNNFIADIKNSKPPDI